MSQFTFVTDADNPTSPHLANAAIRATEFRPNRRV
jgi:hypothetical protein